MKRKNGKRGTTTNGPSVRTYISNNNKCIEWLNRPTQARVLSTNHGPRIPSADPVLGRKTQNAMPRIDPVISHHGSVHMRMQSNSMDPMVINGHQWTPMDTNQCLVDWAKASIDASLESGIHENTWMNCCIHTYLIHTEIHSSILCSLLQGYSVG